LFYPFDISIINSQISGKKRHFWAKIGYFQGKISDFLRFFDANRGILAQKGRFSRVNLTKFSLFYG